MTNTLQCNIVSAEGELYAGKVQMLVAAGENGDLGIYPGHTALLTRLAPGPIKLLLEDGEEKLFFVSGGILEVQPTVVEVLADTALRADDIDEAAAVAAREQAEQDIHNLKDDMDYASVAIQLAEAAGRIRTLAQIRKMGK